MVAMQALHRDVLQWLVLLNLSFPIKNIKRDFSNGFLVVEILSWYFPQDMHSFDYGLKLAKKKDNWDQLRKIFWAKDFPFFQDEIENIINCGPHDGAGPFLERLYGFLTHRRSPSDVLTGPTSWYSRDIIAQGDRHSSRILPNCGHHLPRSKLEKMKAFGRSARDYNISQVSENKKPKEKRPSCREKAIEFASKIPKPKRKVQKENCADHKETPMHPVSELEKMEAKHQMDKKHVEVHKPLLFGVLI
ncbi:hypothetical protein L7F22_030931 [Adiantum nelumboides]|nr:hypothetical protein [Adiantum nelumboides]